jgi:site-specific DNA-methyltransferase (cytosine-N4-specific)
LAGIPWRVAFALQDDGWVLRQDIIWNKTNPKPEPMWGRCAQSHEYLFLLSKSKRYLFNGDAIRGPVKEELREQLMSERDLERSERDEQRYEMAQQLYGANGTQMSKPMSAMFSGYKDLKGPSKKSVWTLPRASFSGAHFAVMPEALVEPCVLAGSAAGDTVLDPFSGSGTVGVVALRHGRNYIGCELNPEYADLSRKRILDDQPLMNTVEVQA